MPGEAHSANSKGELAISLYFRLRHAFGRRSIIEIGRLIRKNILFQLRRLTPRARQLRAQDRVFDETWGTETSNMRDLGSLQVSAERARHGQRYQASSDDDLNSVLDTLDITFPEYTFIDFGCGKGRIILTAALRAFRKVYGVEFSAELASVASNNLRIFRQEAPVKAPVDVVCADAAHFELPAGNLIAYFYNPFDETVMGEVIANLEDSLAEDKDRKIRVIYVDPVCAHVFERSRKWIVDDKKGPLVLSSRRLC